MRTLFHLFASILLLFVLTGCGEDGPANYTITYNLNGGINHAANPASYTESSATITLQPATRTGYTFAGWYELATLTGSPVTEIPAGTTGNRVFWAGWTANTYTVTFDKQEGTGGSDTVTATFGEGMPAAAAPTRDQYIFTGYFDATSGGIQYYNAAMESIRAWDKASAATLYARWSERPGSLDTSFHPGEGANDAIRSLAVQADGKVLIGGYFATVNGTNRVRIARLTATGSLDTTFDPGTGADGSVNRIAVQDDGKILIAGDFSTVNGTSCGHVARLNSGGSLDTGFIKGAGANGQINVLVLQSDGKIIVAGGFTTFNSTNRNYIARINSDGSLDTTFDPDPSVVNATLYAAAIQSDGKILIAGNFLKRIVRLNTDGTVDTGFNPGTGANAGILALALQGDGRILIGGDLTAFNGTPRNYLARLNADGSLDSGFDPGTGANSTVWTMLVDAEGRILIGGFFTTYTGTARQYIARINTDGSLDTSFDPGTGASNVVYALALQSDGKILVGGIFINYDGIFCPRVARIHR